METKSNFRARVMKYAHHLLSTTKKSWKYCLLKAWELYRLAKRMRSGEVKFAYEKVNGSIRYAIGTLKNVPAGAKIEYGPHWDTLSLREARSNCHQPSG